MRHAQLVIGTAGSGKSTYCAVMAEHAATINRTIEVVNLDPAAEHFDYQPLVDIRDLIHVQDTMEDEELHFGPNGGLVFCMEYLLENISWLQDRLGDADNDYILLDCPGQIELYTHLTVMRQIVAKLQDWNFSICSVYLVDVTFMTDGAKFLSGTMAVQSVMLNLELPHLSLLSKMDLLGKSARRRLDRFLEPDARAVLEDMEGSGSSVLTRKYGKLSRTIGDLIEAYAVVRFIPLNLKDPESVADILATVDNVVQYGDDQDVRTVDFDEAEEEEDKE